MISSLFFENSGQKPAGIILGVLDNLFRIFKKKLEFFRNISSNISLWNGKTLKIRLITQCATLLLLLLLQFQIYTGYSGKSAAIDRILTLMGNIRLVLRKNVLNFKVNFYKFFVTIT